MPQEAKKKYVDYEGNPVEDEIIPGKKYVDSSGMPVGEMPIINVKPGPAGTGVVTRGVPGYEISQTERTDTAKGKVAPFAGRAMAEAAPFIGSFGGPGGTMVGTGVKLAMKKYAPETFGEYSPDIYDQIGESLKDLGLNNALPWGLGKIGGAAYNFARRGPGVSTALAFKDAPAIRNAAIGRMTDQIHGMLSGGEINSGTFQPLSFGERTAPFQPIQPVRTGSGGMGEPSENFEAEIRRLMSGGLSTEKEAPAFGIMPKGPVNPIEPTGGGIERILNGPVEDNLKGLLEGRRIEPEKALDELLGKNTAFYRDSMPHGGFESLRSLLETMDRLKATGTGTDKVINYVKGRLVWSAAGAVVGNLFGHPVGGGLAGGITGVLTKSGGPVVLNSILRNIMANPETAQLVVRALQTPAASAEGQFLNKALTNYLPRLIQGGADVETMPEK